VNDGLDEFDLKLLDAIQRNNRLTAAQLADYILVITARNTTDYEAFARKFLSERPHVKYFRTSIVMRRVKWGMTLALKSDQRVPSG